MIEIDARAVVAAVAAFVATAAGPVVVGGWIVAAGAIAAIVTARSVFRGDEGDVTVAVVVGGATIVAALLLGHRAAVAVAVSVFVGSELAAMGRWVQLDHDAPFGHELARAAGSIGLGLAAGGAALAAAQLHASPVVANVALVLVVIAAVVALAVAHTGRSAR